jgi:hypothetical protein
LEDYELMKQHFRHWVVWGQTSSSSGAATVTASTTTVPSSGDQETTVDSSRHAGQLLASGRNLVEVVCMVGWPASSE